MTSTRFEIKFSFSKTGCYKSLESPVFLVFKPYLAGRNVFMPFPFALMRTYMQQINPKFEPGSPIPLSVTISVSPPSDLFYNYYYYE